MGNDFDPTTAPAYIEGAAKSGVPLTATDVDRRPTHEEIVRSRLGWIVVGVWIIAGGVIGDFIAGFIWGFNWATS